MVLEKSEIAGLYCAFRAFHHLIRLNAAAAVSVTRGGGSQQWISHGLTGTKRFPGHLRWSSFCPSAQTGLQFIHLENWHLVSHCQCPMPRHHLPPCRQCCEPPCGFMWWGCQTPPSYVDALLLQFGWHLLEKHLKTGPRGAYRCEALPEAQGLDAQGPRHQLTLTPVLM